MLKKMMSSGLTVEDYMEQDPTSFLGLENGLSESTFQQIILSRKIIRHSILVEQERQFEVGIYDPDCLANISKARSEWSRKRAEVIAQLHFDGR